MPSHVKTYDGSGDPEDHLKLFQSAAKTERWAMPTWCHMFNSTLTRNARVWFDKLLKESIDNYEDLRAAFRENYLHQTKHIKDPVEIHHIKQRNEESTEDFMERYKAEVLDGNSPHSVIVKKSTRAVEATRRRKRAKFQKGFQKQAKVGSEARYVFTPYETLKEIFALEKGKFKAPPPMVTPAEKRDPNKYCEFHTDTGHSTDECMQLRKQIDEMIKLGEEDGTEGPMIIEAEIGGHLASARNKKPDDPSYHITHRIQWRNHLADRPDIPTSKDRRRRAFHFRMDELHGYQVTILTQWNNRQNGYKKDPCCTIHDTQNVKIPSQRRNGDDTKEYSHPDGMCNDLRT
ncbi:reverse transcriptase domain-containing protein [Tanacetum coccineum]